MEVGLPPTLPPVYTASERAALIANAIVASSFDYDIIGLCEVFDEDARIVLWQKLRRRFPYQVTKADYDHVRVYNGVGETLSIGLPVLWALNGNTPGDGDMDYTPQDSGLMLLSRWPFAMKSTAGLNPDIVDEMEDEDMPVPATISIVNFMPYDDCAGNDCGSCKGLVYMRVVRDPARTYHVFFTHTQADTHKVEEEKEVRSKQIAAVEKFIRACTGNVVPFTQEVFFMGDLNIFGEQANSAQDGNEWKNYFGTPGKLLFDYAVDLWGREQCTGIIQNPPPGQPQGLRDPGPTASASYQPQYQRLDYIFGSTASGLAAQHLMIDYDLAMVPPGHPAVSYLSDHRPLRLDLATPRLNSTPRRALLVDLLNKQIFADNNQLLTQGQVKWYRFDAPGTYDFWLFQRRPACKFEVYLDTDLSRPRQQYRQPSQPEKDKSQYVLTSAPFLVKVFPTSRTGGEDVFTFRAHRHRGESPEDAIQLPYRIPTTESFPSGGQILNIDDPRTDWDDKDTKWFRLDGPLTNLKRPLHVKIILDAPHNDPAIGIALVKETAAGWKRIDRGGPGDSHYELNTELDRKDILYIQVQRVDGDTPRDLTFTLTAMTELSILLGSGRDDPRLICQKETSGWGADDIELAISVDGVLLRHVTEHELGGMEQDSVREIAQYLPMLVPYFDGVEFKVIEKDDISKDDIGRKTLLPFKKLTPALGFNTVDGVTTRGSLVIPVDDGTYAVQVAVSSWDEKL